MNSKQLREEIDHMLVSYAAYEYQLHVENDGSKQLNRREAREKIMAAVKDHVEYVIGEDEQAKSDTFIEKTLNALSPDIKMLEHNQLRAEQRNRAGAY